MAKIILGVAVVVLLGAGGFFLYSKKQAQVPLPRLSVYEFKTLPPEVIAQSGEIVVPLANIVDDHYNNLVRKKIELHMALAYQQFGAVEKDALVKFSAPMPEKDLNQVCVLYNLNCYGLEHAHYLDDPAQAYISVDGKSYTVADVNKDNIHWIALESEFTTYILEKVNAYLRDKGLYQLSQQMNKNAADIVEDDILAGRDVNAEVEHMFGEWNTNPQAGKDDKAFKAMFKTQVINSAIDQYLYKSVLRLPIAINLDVPKRRIEMRWDATPHLGKPDSGFDFVIHADFFSTASHQLFRHLEEFHQQYPFITLGFRPFVPAEDRLQRVAGELSLCVWNLDPENFWKFLATAEKWSRNDMENDMYKNMNELKMDSEAMKQCLLRRDSKQAMDFHSQYAQSLGLIVAPVMFIGQEVYIGAIPFYKIEQIVKRQLQ